MYELNSGSTGMTLRCRWAQVRKDGFERQKPYASAIVTSTDVVPSAAGRTSAAGTPAAPFGTSSSALSTLDGAVGLDPAGVPFAPGPASLLVLTMTCHLSTNALARVRKWNSSSRGILSEGCRCIWRITL